MLSSSAIGEKVARTLQDTGNVRFTVPDLAKWINAACRELARHKPTALTAKVSFLLAPGTAQRLVSGAFVSPDDGVSVTATPTQLMDVVRNMGATGITPGSAITGIERKNLDVMLPGWHATPPAAEILFFMFDPKDPLNFHNYPAVPATGAHHVEILVGRSPENALADNATVLGVDDIDAGLSASYEDILVDGVLAHAFSSDGESPIAGQRAAWHEQRFQQALGVKFKNEVVLAPKEQFKRQEG